MTTDLSRLHDVIEGRISGRRVGKTFARIHELAGAIETGSREIVCVVTRLSDREYLAPMIAGIFQEHEILSWWSREHEIRTPSARIRFALETEVEFFTREAAEYTLIYMRHED